MAHSHCRGPVTGTRPGPGLGTMEFCITLRTVLSTLRQRPGTGPEPMGGIPRSRSFPFMVPYSEYGPLIQEMKRFLSEYRNETKSMDIQLYMKWAKLQLGTE